MSRHTLQPISSWEPTQLALLRDTRLGPIPWESARPTSDCGNFPQALAAAGTPPSEASKALLLPSLTEQVSLNELLLLPLLVWVGKTLEGGLQTEVGPKPKWSTRGCANKEEEGNSLL